MLLIFVILIYLQLGSCDIIANTSQHNLSATEKFFFQMHAHLPITMRLRGKSRTPFYHVVRTQEELWYEKYLQDINDVPNLHGYAQHAAVGYKSLMLFTVPVCPAYEFFKHTSLEDLKCDEKIQQRVQSTSTFEVDEINLSSVTKTVLMCLCKKRTVEHGCTYYFFGSQVFDQAEWYNAPVQEECVAQCKADQKAGRESSVSGYEPRAPCNWPVRTTRQGTLIHTQLVPVTYQTLTKSIMSPIIKHGWCKPHMGECQVEYPYKLFVHEPLQEECDYATNHARYYADVKGNMTILESMSTLFQYPVLGGCILHHCGKTILSLPSGQLFGMDKSVLSQFQVPACDERAYKLPTRSELPPQIQPNLEDLYKEYDLCILKRQVLKNALSTGVPIDSQLLASFNRDSGLRSVQHEIKYLIVNKQLMSASCPLNTYDTIEWIAHDIWALKREHKNIGCLDARLNTVFQGLCRPYNRTAAYRALGIWQFVLSNGTWSAQQSPYSVDSIIYKVTGNWVSNNMVSDLINDNNSPVLIDPEYVPTQDMPTGEKNHGISFDLFSFLPTFFGVSIPLIVIILIIVCCCCHYKPRIYRRVHDVEMQNIQNN
nr:TPA_asm: glycoprotein [Microrhabdovirus]